MVISLVFLVLALTGVVVYLYKSKKEDKVFTGLCLILTSFILSMGLLVGMLSYSDQKPYTETKCQIEESVPEVQYAYASRRNPSNNVTLCLMDGNTASYRIFNMNAVTLHYTDDEPYAILYSRSNSVLFSTGDCTEKVEIYLKKPEL